MMHAGRIIIGGMCGFLISTSDLANAQGGTPGASIGERQEGRTNVRNVIDSVGRLLETHSVSEDTGRAIAKLLPRRLETHAYDALSPAEFRPRVTPDLQTINGEVHCAGSH
jgi:hypothetical protein